MSVTEKIRNQIMLGKFAPGTHLHEVQLAEDLEVSRTPIRAALTALAQEGLVTYEPNKGYQVRPFTTQDIVHAYDVRAALEGTAARIAAENGLPQHILDQLAEGLRYIDNMLVNGRLSDGDIDDWRKTNMVFHNSIQDVTENRFLREGLIAVRNIPMVSNSVFHWYSYSRVQQYHLQHHSIFDALVKRQGSRAESLMREHIYQASRFIVEQFKP